MKLSLIIPVYNVEIYIRRCLDSIFTQDVSLEGYEVIIVDDETPDDSMSIVEEFAYKFTNLKIIHQKNQGLSGARNTGLKAATGDYVWFVDSDDRIEINCFSQIINYLDNNPCLILAFDFLKIDSKNETTRNSLKFNSNSKFMNGLDFLNLNGAGQAWRNIYSRHFLLHEQIFFKVGMLHEDGEFNMRAKVMAKTVSYLPKIFYYYYAKQEGSIMNTISLRHVCDLINYSLYAKTFIEEKKITMKAQKGIFTASAYAILMSVDEFKYLSPKDKKEFFEYMIITHKYWLKACLFSNLFKYKLIGIGLILFPRLIIKLYQFNLDFKNKKL